MSNGWTYDLMLSLDLRQILPPKKCHFSFVKVQISSKILPHIAKFGNFVKNQYFRHDGQFSSKRNSLEPTQNFVCHISVCLFGFCGPDFNSPLLVGCGLQARRCTLRSYTSWSSVYTCGPSIMHMYFVVVLLLCSSLEYWSLHDRKLHVYTMKCVHCVSTLTVTECCWQVSQALSTRTDCMLSRQ